MHLKCAHLYNFMKELTRHIEALLLENDCVILPHFGGFITNHVPAQWVEEEGIFLPPYRTVGFNAQLKLNDGLLVQSYMLTHDATYPEATRLVEAAIERLTEFLYKDGMVEFQGIGCLFRTIDGEYRFEPTQDGVITPALYGLSSLPLPTLAQLAASRVVVADTAEDKVTDEQPVQTSSSSEVKEKDIVIRIRHKWIANVAAIAAAIALFFVMSTPVVNTDIVEENYASLGCVSVFEQVESQSLLTNLLEIPRSATPAPVVAKETKKPEVSQPVVPVSPTPTSQPVAKELAKQSADVAQAPVEAPKAEKPVAAPVETKAPEAKPAQVPAKPRAEAAPATPKQAPVAKPAAQPKKSVTYNIIVASVGSESDAQTAISNFASKGHPGAFLIKGNGRFRIAIAAFDSEADAYRRANELKQQDIFKDAWVLKSRR